MLLIFLDTETTGVNPEKHRTIEIAFKIYDSETGDLEASYESIVYQPMEIWAEADPKSLECHGFAFEEVLKGKREKVIEGEIITYLNNANIVAKSGVFICQNPSFDRSFFNQIVNVDIQRSYNWPYHWLDLASMYWASRLFHHTPITDEEELSKDKIAEYFNLPQESRPHRAMNGVNHLILCYETLFNIKFAMA